MEVNVSVGEFLSAGRTMGARAEAIRVPQIDNSFLPSQVATQLEWKFPFKSITLCL